MSRSYRNGGIFISKRILQELHFFREEELEQDDAEVEGSGRLE
jgi:hypothetical protein